MSWYEKVAVVVTVVSLVGFVATLVWDALGPRNLARFIERLIQ